MMIFSRALFLAVVLCVAVAPSARADDYSVDSPEISPGLSAEANLNYSYDNREQLNHYSSQLYGVGYGFNEHWSAGAAALVEGTDGKSPRVTDVRLEGAWVPFKPGEKVIDVGASLALNLSTGDTEPDTAEAKLLLEKEIAPFTLTANFGLSQNFGQNATGGLEAGYALRASYHASDSLEPGIEYYSDLGRIADIEHLRRQDNAVGPVLQGQAGRIGYDAGALFGVSESAHDATFKLNLEFGF